MSNTPYPGEVHRDFHKGYCCNSEITVTKGSIILNILINITSTKHIFLQLKNKIVFAAYLNENWTNSSKKTFVGYCNFSMSTSHVCVFSVVVESWGMFQNVKALQLGAFLEKHPFSDPHLRIVPTKVHHQRSIPCTCLETILSGLAISLAKGNSWVDSLRKPKAMGTWNRAKPQGWS